MRKIYTPKFELFIIFAKHNQRIDNKAFDIARLLNPEFFELITHLFLNSLYNRQVL